MTLHSDDRLAGDGSTPAPQPLRPRPRLWVLLALFALPFTGMVACNADGEAAAPASTLEPEEFIEIVVELREAEREVESADSTGVAFARRRSEILARRSATEEDLREFVAVHHGDFDLMDRVWETINQRLKRPRPRHAAPDSAAGSARDAGQGSEPGDSAAPVAPPADTAEVGTDVAPVKGPRQ